MNNNLKVAEAPDTIEYSYNGAKTRSRRAAYSFHITHEGNEAAILAGNASPAKTFDSYTWPESRAPSRDVTPVPPLGTGQSFDKFFLKFGWPRQ